MTIVGKSSLASDLASELGLPRSTINDWLTRYADYLESESRGKRRAYSAKSLNILREIGEMRNRGLSSFDIEQQLASRYGLRPEVAQAPAAEDSATGNAPAASREENGGDPGTVQLPALTADTALPMLRPVFEELSGHFRAECEKLAGQLEKAEAERRRLVRRIWTMSAFLLVGACALLLLLGATLYVLYGRMEQENRSTRGAVERLSTGIAERGEIDRREAEAAATRLDEMNVRLDRSPVRSSPANSRPNCRNWSRNTRRKSKPPPGRRTPPTPRAKPPRRRPPPHAENWKRAAANWRSCAPASRNWKPRATRGRRLSLRQPGSCRDPRSRNRPGPDRTDETDPLQQSRRIVSETLLHTGGTELRRHAGKSRGGDARRTVGGKGGRRQSARLRNRSQLRTARPRSHDGGKRSAQAPSLRRRRALRRGARRREFSHFADPRGGVRLRRRDLGDLKPRSSGQ